jgi:hypothetical protein
MVPCLELTGGQVLELLFSTARAKAQVRRILAAMYFQFTASDPRSLEVQVVN